MYQDNPCAIGGFLPASNRCHQTVMYTIAPQFTCVTWRILLMRSAASQLLISFSTSISLPLNIVIFIVERFSWTPTATAIPARLKRDDSRRLATALTE